MEIPEVLDIMKELSEDKISEAKHFGDACEDRELDRDEVYGVVQKNKVVGIEKQDEKENLYKIIYYYTDRKDLNIITKVVNKEKIKLITVFPSYAERRKR